MVDVVNQIDPLVASLTSTSVESAITEFMANLDSHVSEEVLHAFLASHTYFFAGPLRLHGLCPVYSKVKLGSEYVTDFAWFDSGSHGPDWRLVEIEGPAQKMFTKSGDFSAPMNHAVQQILNWHNWIHVNLAYARNLMPNIEYPLGYLFIGRASELSDGDRKKLRGLQHHHRRAMEIHTLDYLAGAAREALSLVVAENGGSWLVPLNALTHDQLAGGLPVAAKTWLDDPNTIWTLNRHRNDRLAERDRRVPSA